LGGWVACIRLEDVKGPGSSSRNQKVSSIHILRSPSNNYNIPLAMMTLREIM
jgi:hypothetical protein